MDLLIAKELRKFCLSIGLMLLLCCAKVFATTSYDYTNGALTPSFPNPCTSSCTTQPPVPPTTSGTQFTNGDSVEVVNGTMATPSSSTVGYTIGITDTSSSSGIAVNVTVDQGATLSYYGNNNSAATIYSTRADNQPTTTTITNNGTISNGTGLYSMQFINSSTAPADTYNVTVGTSSTVTGNVSGPISFQGVNTAAVTLNSGSSVTTTGPVAYTMGLVSSNTSNGPIFSVTIAPGASAIYAGTGATGAVIYSTRADTAATSETFNISGAVTASTGLYGIYLANTTSSTPADTYNINISTTGSVTGSIFSNGVNNINLNLTGNATVTGVINLATATTGFSTLTVGAAGTAIFTPSESIENIGLLHLTNNSTMTLGVVTTSINSVTVESGSNLYVNNTLNGLSVSDGNIINNGNMYIAANIAKTGTFTGTGTNWVTEGSATGVSVTTSTYTINTHNAVMTDVNNYGNITLSAANFSPTNTFNVIYGTNGYTAGYFPGGIYTLATTSSGTCTLPNTTTYPSPTLFLSFSNLQTANSNTQVQVTLTRTPFNTYTSTPLTQSIASTLELIGSSNPNSAMLSLLDAIETSTTGGQVQAAMELLAPLSDAPFYGYDVQNDSMYQVQLRLASLRDGTAQYCAGEGYKDLHMWARPFGAYANQRPKDDSFGYWGSTGGIAVGLDHDLNERYTMGAAFAYALSHVTEKINSQSVTDLKSYIGMLYGTYNSTPSQFLDWIIAITSNNFNAFRYININNIYIDEATSKYGSQQLSAMAIWGTNYEAFGFMQLTPQGLAQYTFTKQYTYSETGAAGANLNIERTNSDIVTLGVGGIAAIPFFADPSIIMPEIHGWVFYNPIVGKQNTIFNFIDGGPQMISYMNLSRTGVLIGAALTIAVIDQLEVKANFDYDMQDRFTGYTAYLNLRYSF